MSGFQNDPGLTQQEAGFGFDGFLWCESRDLGLTAIGTTQGSALQLNKMISLVTGATASSAPFNGVLLPPTRPTIIGVSLCIINAAPNNINVYGTGSDLINGAAAVMMQPNSVAFYQCTGAVGVNNQAAGAWVVTGIGFGYGVGNAAGFTTYSSQDNITATPSGTQNTALVLTATNSRITTVASSGDAVRLPPAQAGMELTILNDATTNPMNVFPASQAQGGVSGGDSINGGTQNSAVSLTAQNGGGSTGPTIFYCFSTGKWRTK